MEEYNIVKPNPIEEFLPTNSKVQIRSTGKRPETEREREREREKEIKKEMNRQENESGQQETLVAPLSLCSNKAGDGEAASTVPEGKESTRYDK